MIIERMDRPTALAVDLEEAKNHARVDGDYDDFALAQMIATATREAEDYAQVALLAQPIRVILPCWPQSLTLQLPIGPVFDWSSITILAGTEPIDDFSVMTGRRPAVRLATARPAGVIIIDDQAGYGDEVSDIPPDLRHALLDQVAIYYDARGAVDRKTVSLSPHFARIVGRYRGVRT